MYLVTARVLRWYMRGMNRRIEGGGEPLPAEWFRDGMGNPAYDVAPFDRAVAEIEGWRFMDKLYRLAANAPRRAIAS